MTTSLNLEQRLTFHSITPAGSLPLADVLHYPEWVFAICVLLSILPVVAIPLVAFYKFMCLLKNYTMNRHNQNPYANEYCHGEL